MKKKMLAILTAATLCALCFLPGCNAWEGRYALTKIEAYTYSFTDNTSRIAILAEVANMESKGLEAYFVNFEFMIYQDDELIFNIHRFNYLDFEFLITLTSTDIATEYWAIYPGTLNLITGRSHDNWKVPGDIFNGRTPNRMVYKIYIEDENGYDHTFEGELEIKHQILDY